MAPTVKFHAPSAGDVLIALPTWQPTRYSSPPCWPRPGPRQAVGANAAHFEKDRRSVAAQVPVAMATLHDLSPIYATPAKQARAHRHDNASAAPDVGHGAQPIQVISSESPLGKAMGKCEGHEASIQVAANHQQFEVLRVH